MKQVLNRIVLPAILLSLLLIGCGAVKNDPPYVNKVILDYGNPGSDPRCTCKQSRPAFLTNTDQATTRFVKTLITVKLPNTDPVVSPRTDILKPLEKLYIGCTIDPIGQPAACLQVNTFIKDDESTLRLSSSVPRGTVLSSPFFVNDVTSCAALCTHGTSCYSLGVDAAPIAIPFITLLDGANSEDGTLIKKTDLLAKYNKKESDDKCGRGNVTRKGVMVLNEGADKCELQVGAITEVKLPDEISFFLPKVVQGTAIEASTVAGLKSSSPEDKIIAFENAPVGPAIGFSGKNGKDLTDLYGGRVRSVARVGPDLVFSNSNGCMRIKLK